MINLKATIKQNLKDILPKHLYKSIVLLKYKGNKYKCPFCNGHFSSLMPAGLNLPVLKEKQVIGAGYRLNSKCPQCSSGDRERLVYLYLKKEKPYIFSSKIKLLHIAPEKNLTTTFKSHSNIDYISADLYSPVADIKMDITDIKQNNETYDVIICNHVLEHIINDHKAMTELHRVLKKKGFAILQVPISYSIEQTFEDESITSPEDREKIFGQDDHVRIYAHDYVSRLTKAGFTVVEYQFTDDIIDRYRLIKEEKVFVCYKS